MIIHMVEGQEWCLKPEPFFAAVKAVHLECGYKAAYYSYVPTRRTLHSEKSGRTCRRSNILFSFVVIMKAMMNEFGKQLVTDELSIGDFVLTGGEIACDGCCR